MPVKVEGINDVKRLLKNADLKTRLAVNQEIHKMASEILSESKALVPFQDGMLRGSGTLQAGGAASTTVMSQTISFGGPAAPYALVQHENLKYFHPAKARGGTSPGTPGETRGAKYLEWPVKRKRRVLVPRLLAAIRAVN